MSAAMLIKEVRALLCIGSSSHDLSTLQLHDKVIDDVVKGVRAEFLEQGVDPLAIDELKEVGNEHLRVFLSFSLSPLIASCRQLWRSNLAAIHDDDAEEVLFGKRPASPPSLLPPPMEKKARTDYGTAKQE